MPDKPRDILDSDVRFPATVYVVATGKESPEVYALIPPDAFVIAVNGAIEIPLPVVPAIWLLADPKSADTDYCKAGMELVQEGKYPLSPDKIKANTHTIPLVEVNHILPKYPFCKATFKIAPSISAAFTKETCFRNAATTSGIAVQLCYLKGVRRVITIGVHLSGNEYWDGLNNENPDKDNSVWKSSKDYWNWMIHVLTIEGNFSVEALREPIKQPVMPGRYREKILAAQNKIESKPVEKPLPSIGYLCMTRDPIDMMNAITDFMNQDYPNHKKKLYLLKQRDSHGDFPPPLVNNIGLQIIDVDCDGYSWPELWTFKVVRYLEECDTEYTLWFDEDDRYPPDYTRGCAKPILDGLGEMAWSWDCIIAEYVVECNRFEFRECWYRSPVGQMIIKTDLLRGYIKRLWGILYDGTFQSPKRRRNVPYGGAQDDQLRQTLQREINPIPHHRAQRVYFIHGQANSAQLRPAGNALDYWGKRNDDGENAPIEGRFNQPRQ